MPTDAPGRTCPLRYRYSPRAIAAAPERPADTLYVVGGLYGNLAALDAVEAMARAEAGAPRVCFNGDFHWFDVDDASFAEITRRVLRHEATLGNVEAELAAKADDAGCGCAYPDTVDAGTVARSNAIHATLKATASRHPGLVATLAALPMVARYRVGDCRVGVVHGDAESLAGWRFDASALDDPAAAHWLARAFDAAGVDVFASTHTCLPAMRRVDRSRGYGWIVNNGAAGMPNFRTVREGHCTRIGRTPSPHAVAHEIVVAGSHVALLPVRYDAARWEQQFLAQWPPGSPAWLSYYERIRDGPAFTPAQAFGPARCSPR